MMVTEWQLNRILFYKTESVGHQVVSVQETANLGHVTFRSHYHMRSNLI